MPIAKLSDFVREYKRHPDRFYIIHYSCQNLNDENEALSPRITSIAILHFATHQVVSFSTHAIAEELHIGREHVIGEFDRIEKRLLDRFYEFVQNRRDRYWIHWHMRSLTYGFEHLEHRYSVLGGTNAPIIPVESRINLSDMIQERYGTDYVTHPKLQSLMEINGGLHRDFLSGEQEVSAFNSQEFLKMHKSTICKVGFFAKVMDLLRKGQLKTKSTGYGVRLDRLFESRTAKAIGLVSGIVGLLLFIREVLSIYGISVIG